LFKDNGSTLRCIVCHAALSPNSLADCPRCGADNRACQAWLRAGLPAHLKRFFSSSPWGWLALLSLLAPPAVWLGWGGLALAGAYPLAPAGLAVLSCLRHPLWTGEQARRVSPGRRPGLLALGGGGFLLFSVVAALHLAASGPQSPGAALSLTLALSVNTWAAGLYAIHAYGLWLSRTFPRPIFADEAKLLRLVLGAARPRIQFKSGSTYEAVTTQVVSLSRTAQAGLNLKIRAEAGTDQTWEGRSLTAIQHWRVVSDKWGHVIQLEQEGPLEYVPDFTTLPGADTNQKLPERRAVSSRGERGAGGSYSASAAVNPGSS
jgi:hypothetical protein